MQRWRTLDRPRAEQYDYWREVVCAAFTPLRPAARGRADTWDRDGLAGWVDAAPLGRLNAAEIGTCAQTIHHGPGEVRRTDEPVVFVNLMLRGRSVVEQGDLRTLSEPGTFTVVDTTRPFRLDYLDDWRALSFRVPHDCLEARLPERLSAVRHEATHGLAGVLADAMRAAWRSAADLSGAEAASVGAALTGLVEAVVEGGPAVGRRASADTPLDPVALRGRVERYAVTQLPDGDLSPAAVARRFGLSLRSLHLLYADAPASYSRTVMSLRARACAADLVRPGPPTTLTAVAAAWGFSDLSHLNRVFRREHGCSATEYRDRWARPV